MTDREPPQHDPAAARFAVLTMLRFASVGLVMLGIAITFGALDVPGIVGIALILAGMGVFFFGTRRLARRWKSPDVLPPADNDRDGAGR